MRHDRYRYSSIQRRNYADFLTPQQAANFAALITSVGKTGGTGIVSIYCSKDNKDAVKEFLRFFNGKFPYNSLTWMGNRWNYDCKRSGGNTMYVQRDKLYAELYPLIALGTTLRKQAEDSAAGGDGTGNNIINPFDELLAALQGYTIGGSGGDGSDGSDGSGTTNPNKSNINNLLLYIGVGAAAFLVVFLIMRRKKK